MSNTKSSKKLVLAAVSAVLLATPVFTSAANAGAVTNFGTDSFSAEPYLKGTNIVQLRMDGSFIGNPIGPLGSTLMPGINFTTALFDGVDMGIGGGATVGLFDGPGVSVLPSALYPWIRAAIPLGLDNLKTGLVVGTSIPLNTTNKIIPAVSNMNSRMGSEFYPGVTALADIYLGQMLGTEIPLTLGLNAGYARGISSGTNLLSGNLNFTVPLTNLIITEEQFVNYPIGSVTNGGFRVGVSVPIADKYLIDVKPAALWSQEPQGLGWSFNPTVGVSMKF